MSDLVPRQTFGGPRRWATPSTELSALLAGIACSLPLFAAGHDEAAAVAALVGFALILRVHPGRRQRSVTVGADGFELDGTFVPWARVEHVAHVGHDVVVDTNAKRWRLRVHDPSALRHAIAEARSRHAAPPSDDAPKGDYRTAVKSKRTLVRVVTSCGDLSEREAAFAQLDAASRETVLSAMADSRTRKHLES